VFLFVSNQPTHNVFFCPRWIVKARDHRLLHLPVWPLYDPCMHTRARKGLDKYESTITVGLFSIIFIQCPSANSHLSCQARVKWHPRHPGHALVLLSLHSTLFGGCLTFPKPFLHDPSKKPFFPVENTNDLQYEPHSFHRRLLSLNGLTTCPLLLKTKDLCLHLPESSFSLSIVVTCLLSYWGL